MHGRLASFHRPVLLSRGEERYVWGFGFRFLTSVLLFLNTVLLCLAYGFLSCKRNTTETEGMANDTVVTGYV